MPTNRSGGDVNISLRMRPRDYDALQVLARVIRKTSIAALARQYVLDGIAGASQNGDPAAQT
ncbi:hypothetical protein ACFYO1_02480 [Nocardia sp. NPDC006044]|uniref:hypothetical protein n=1 Tax=Nocardia sp. NPDC006044 TaxID=3364306 RepID=UPI0036A1E738